jgi:hypothetical protein
MVVHIDNWVMKHERDGLCGMATAFWLHALDDEIWKAMRNNVKIFL